MASHGAAFADDHEACARAAAEASGRVSSGVEEEFLASAALALNTLVFCRSEMIPTRELLVIERGIAAKHGRVHTKGGTLGEDMILNTDFVMGFRDLTSAIALTFVVQAAQLEKRNLDRLLSEYPKARAAVQRRAYKLAFRKAMFLVAANARARAHRAHQQLRPPSSLFLSIQIH